MGAISALVALFEGKSTGDQRIPFTKASNADIWYLFDISQ